MNDGSDTTYVGDESGDETKTLEKIKTYTGELKDFFNETKDNFKNIFFELIINTRSINEDDVDDIRFGTDYLVNPSNIKSNFSKILDTLKFKDNLMEVLKIENTHTIDGGRERVSEKFDIDEHQNKIDVMFTTSNGTSLYLYIINYIELLIKILFHKIGNKLNEDIKSNDNASSFAEYKKKFAYNTTTEFINSKLKNIIDEFFDFYDTDIYTLLNDGKRIFLINDCADLDFAKKLTDKDYYKKKQKVKALLNTNKQYVDESFYRILNETIEALINIQNDKLIQSDATKTMTDILKISAERFLEKYNLVGKIFIKAVGRINKTTQELDNDNYLKLEANSNNDLKKFDDDNRIFTRIADLLFISSNKSYMLGLGSAMGDSAIRGEDRRLFFPDPSVHDQPEGWGNTGALKSYITSIGSGIGATGATIQNSFFITRDKFKRTGDLIVEGYKKSRDKTDTYIKSSEAKTNAIKLAQITERQEADIEAKAAALAAKEADTRATDAENLVKLKIAEAADAKKKREDAEEMVEKKKRELKATDSTGAAERAVVELRRVRDDMGDKEGVDKAEKVYAALIKVVEAREALEAKGDAMNAKKVYDEVHKLRKARLQLMVKVGAERAEKVYVADKEQRDAKKNLEAVEAAAAVQQIYTVVNKLREARVDEAEAVKAKEAAVKAKEAATDPADVAAATGSVTAAEAVLVTAGQAVAAAAAAVATMVTGVVDPSKKKVVKAVVKAMNEVVDSIAPLTVGEKVEAEKVVDAMNEVVKSIAPLTDQQKVAAEKVVDAMNEVVKLGGAAVAVAQYNFDKMELEEIKTKAEKQLAEAEKVEAVRIKNDRTQGLMKAADKAGPTGKVERKNINKKAKEAVNRAVLVGKAEAEAEKRKVDIELNTAKTDAQSTAAAARSVVDNEAQIEYQKAKDLVEQTKVEKSDAVGKTVDKAAKNAQANIVKGKTEEFTNAEREKEKAVAKRNQLSDALKAAWEEVANARINETEKKRAHGDAIARKALAEETKAATDLKVQEAERKKLEAEAAVVSAKNAVAAAVAANEQEQAKAILDIVQKNLDAAIEEEETAVKADKKANDEKQEAIEEEDRMNKAVAVAATRAAAATRATTPVSNDLADAERKVEEETTKAAHAKRVLEVEKTELNRLTGRAAIETALPIKKTEDIKSAMKAAQEKFESTKDARSMMGRVRYWPRQADNALARRKVTGGSINDSISNVENTYNMIGGLKLDINPKFRRDFSTKARSRNYADDPVAVDNFIMYFLEITFGLQLLLKRLFSGNDISQILRDFFSLYVKKLYTVLKPNISANTKLPIIVSNYSIYEITRKIIFSCFEKFIKENILINDTSASEDSSDLDLSKDITLVKLSFSLPQLVDFFVESFTNLDNLDNNILKPGSNNALINYYNLKLGNVFNTSVEKKEDFALISDELTKIFKITDEDKKETNHLKFYREKIHKIDKIINDHEDETFGLLIEQIQKIIPGFAITENGLLFESTEFNDLTIETKQSDLEKRRAELKEELAEIESKLTAGAAGADGAAVADGADVTDDSTE